MQRYLGWALVSVYNSCHVCNTESQSFVQHNLRVFSHLPSLRTTGCASARQLLCGPPETMGTVR